MEVAKSGQFVFVRQLIAESDLEEQLFPLARAIDYLQTGDAALIEKLSPEVKGIVEEVVETLRTVATGCCRTASMSERLGSAIVTIHYNRGR